MADKSHIQWTDATWNPVTGCTKISTGCANCYIERTPAFRIAGRTFEAGKIPVQLHHERLDQPLRWRKPRRIFVNSLSDLFHEDVPDKFIRNCFETMRITPRHTYQVLTKRPERMIEFILREQRACAVIEEATLGGATVTFPYPNVWLGVSCENQKAADERIPLLLQTPASVRFISAEPLMGPLNLCWASRLTARNEDPQPRWIHQLDWVIVGGESGPGARPFNIQWARDTIKQCRAAGVPVFVKQLGSNAHINAMDAFPPGATEFYTKDRKGGDMAEWPEDLRVRQFPEVKP